MKKISVIFVCSLLVLQMTLISFSFTNHSPINNDPAYIDEIIMCSDGSLITVYINEPSVKASGAKVGSKTYVCTKNGADLWTAVLTGIFTYTGTSSTCTSANCTVTFQNSQFSLKEKNVTTSGNTAIATVVVVQKVLGITISTNTQTLTLSCDSNGNLS